MKYYLDRNVYQNTAFSWYASHIAQSKLLIISYIGDSIISGIIVFKL